MEPQVRQSPSRLLVLGPALLLDTAFTADLLGRLFGVTWLWTAGAHLAVAGVAAGLALGLPAGALASRGQGRPLRFVALYLLGLALFALTRWVRGDAAIPPEGVLVTLEGIAAVLAYAGSAAGGLLLQRAGAAVSP
ncbi:MAG TPA: hypothetical protein VHG28_09845 [Longimicrobiaceae bacterium]|nr:hypothetical protein [Longimicrobiaceae bacterium]